MIQAECHAADNPRGWSSRAVADALSVRPGYERVRDVIRLREIVLEPSPGRIHYGRLSRVA
jgi:hypothetical protein